MENNLDKRVQKFAQEIKDLENEIFDLQDKLDENNTLYESIKRASDSSINFFSPRNKNHNLEKQNRIRKTIEELQAELNEKTTRLKYCLQEQAKCLDDGLRELDNRKNEGDNSLLGQNKSNNDAIPGLNIDSFGDENIDKENLINERNNYHISGNKSEPGKYTALEGDFDEKCNITEVNLNLLDEDRKYDQEQDKREIENTKQKEESGGEIQKTDSANKEEKNEKIELTEEKYINSDQEKEQNIKQDKSYNIEDTIDLQKIKSDQENIEDVEQERWLAGNRIADGIRKHIDKHRNENDNNRNIDMRAELKQSEYVDIGELNSEIKSGELIVLESERKKETEFLDQIYRKVEKSLALLNGDRNMCKKELQQVKKMINDYVKSLPL